MQIGTDENIEYDLCSGRGVERVCCEALGKLGMGRRPLGMRLETGRANCEEPGCRLSTWDLKTTGAKEGNLQARVIFCPEKVTPAVCGRG